MADQAQNFTDMFKNLGEQLKLPQVDMAKIMEHHQKNLDAMARAAEQIVLLREDHDILLERADPRADVGVAPHGLGEIGPLRQ